MCSLDIGTATISRSRWLIPSILLLLSAFVLAEQSEELSTYDNLMKDSIYASSGSWRKKQTTAEDDWRSQKNERAFGFGSLEKSKEAPRFDNEARDRFNFENSEASDRFNFENSEAGYQLFKIKI